MALRRSLLKHMRRSGLALCIGACSMNVCVAAEAAEPAAPSLWSKEDGQLDISSFVDQAYGFIPLIFPITEPAVGLGGVAVLAFVDRPPAKDAQAGFGRPNITALGALGTENGTRGGLAGDIRYWLDDSLKTVVGAAKASVNLQYYGDGTITALQSAPQTYNLDTSIVLAEARYRLGRSPWWLGLGYTWSNTTASFDASAIASWLPVFQRTTQMAAVSPVISYDSRNSPFTPTEGSLVELKAGLFDEAWGSDSEFRRLELTGVHYLPLASRWNLGLLGSVTGISGEAPFYMQPFVAMRGVPAMSYQGQNVGQVEAELSWQLWQRWSVVLFGGVGLTQQSFGSYDNSREVVAGGAGFRYEIARKYGIQMGLDFARGPDGNAVYLTFGSAWLRP